MLLKSKLATVAAAGAVCAVAASTAALAAPPPVWSKPSTIPGSYTNATPGLAAYYYHNVRGTFVTWKGQNSNDVYYRFKYHGKWSRTERVPGAGTTDGPAAAFYTNYRGVPSELVAWKALHSNIIWYATGEITGGNSLSWSKTRSIAVKGDKLATSSTGPSVIFPLNSPNARVIIAWRGPGHHVRYELGAQSGRYFSFDKSQWISGGTATDSTLTSDTPALAEVIGAGGNGTVYVFWKADGKGETLSYASTPDLAKSGLQGSKTVKWTLLGFVPGGASTSGPAAADVNAHGTGPLMLAYKGPSGDHIRYQFLTGTTWSGIKYVSGAQNKTTLSPALLNTLLANVAPTSSGVIYLRSYNG
jgi:hypothetical protein